MKGFESQLHGREFLFPVRGLKCHKKLLPADNAWGHCSSGVQSSPFRGGFLEKPMRLTEKYK